MNAKVVEVVEGYDPLASVLVEALDQAQRGKGKKCHANGLPFLQQPISAGGRECGPGGLAFQVRKKILEALNCEDDERAITDLTWGDELRGGYGAFATRAVGDYTRVACFLYYRQSTAKCLSYFAYCLVARVSFAR